MFAQDDFENGSVDDCFGDELDELWGQEAPDDEFHKDGCTWSDLIRYRVENEQPITDADVAFVNHGILHELDSVESLRESAEAAYAVKDEDVGRVRAMWDDMGLNTKDPLPAYASQALERAGASLPPDELAKKYDDEYADFMEGYRSDKEDFFESVYEVQTMCCRDMPRRCTGPGPRGGNREIEFVSQSTKEALGPEYDAFCSRKFSEHIHEIGERHIGKSFRTGQPMLGIDVTRTGHFVDKEAVKHAEPSVQHDHEPEVRDLEDWSDNRDASRTNGPVKTPGRTGTRRLRRTEMDGQTVLSEPVSHVGEFEDDVRADEEDLERMRDGLTGKGGYDS